MTKDERMRFTFRIPNELFMQLKDEAESRCLSLNELILRILWKRVKKAEKEGEGWENRKSGN